MFPYQWDKGVSVSRILLPLRLQLKAAQMYLSHVALKRWASLWSRGEFCEMILAYILAKSNWRKNWSRMTTRSIVRSWIRQQLENDSDFYRKIIFSDKAHFWLNAFVNKQNMRFWSDSNPHVLHESSLHTEKLRFGAVYGPAASLGRISSVMIKIGMLLWIRIAQW